MLQEPLNYGKYTKEELITLCETYNSKINYLESKLHFFSKHNRHVEIGRAHV